MIKFRHLIIILLLTLHACKNTNSNKSEKRTDTVEEIPGSKPTVSFTFDDGNTANLAGFEFEQWNNMILSHLEIENLKAVFFVTGKNKLDEKGERLLKSWNNRGHQIANHSFSHPNFNAKKNTAQRFENELKRTDSIISKLSNSVKLFRFPYLKEGENAAKADSLRAILSHHGYQNGYVTIDASDWFVDQRLLTRIKQVGLEKAEIEKYKDFYLQHILERAHYYEQLSYELNNRHIKHTLLLHHNLVSALFLDDLIAAFKEKGWEVTDAPKAYQDIIFRNIPPSEYAGESLIYSQAKASGKHSRSLRYPAEDGLYEKDKMNKLGL